MITVIRMTDKCRHDVYYSLCPVCCEDMLRKERLKVYRLYHDHIKKFLPFIDYMSFRGPDFDIPWVIKNVNLEALKRLSSWLKHKDDCPYVEGSSVKLCTCGLMKESDMMRRGIMCNKM